MAGARRETWKPSLGTRGDVCVYVCINGYPPWWATGARRKTLKSSLGTRGYKCVYIWLYVYGRVPAAVIDRHPLCMWKLSFELWVAMLTVVAISLSVVCCLPDANLEFSWRSLYNINDYLVAESDYLVVFFFSSVENINLTFCKVFTSRNSFLFLVSLMLDCHKNPMGLVRLA